MALCELSFVTNGTSTANKIVLQALVAPGDLVLIDRDCHKSHHYGLVLSGAYPVYLDSYPIEKYSIYGAVSFRTRFLKNCLFWRLPVDWIKWKCCYWPIAPLMGWSTMYSESMERVLAIQARYGILMGWSLVCFRRIYLHLQAANVECSVQKSCMTNTKLKLIGKNIRINITSLKKEKSLPYQILIR